MSQEEIEDLARSLDVKYSEAEKIWNEAKSELVKLDGLIVAETSTVATRFDYAKAVVLKKPKGKRGVIAPIVCGFCGSIKDQEVEK